MNREVCGICWCPYDDNGACGCKPQTGATMKRDDIIRMAQESGFAGGGCEALFRFAALVTAAKDAEHQQTLALQQRSYEREIQLEVEAERERIGDQCAEQIKTAIEDEREACAKLAESTVCDTHLPTGVRIYGTRVAAAIRTRTP